MHKIRKWLELGEKISSNLILEKTFSAGNQTPIFRIYEDKGAQKVRNELAIGLGPAAHYYGELFVAVPEMLRELRRTHVEEPMKELSTIDKETLQTLVDAASECLSYHEAAYGDHPTDKRWQDEMRS